MPRGLAAAAALLATPSLVGWCCPWRAGASGGGDSVAAGRPPWWSMVGARRGVGRDPKGRATLALVAANVNSWTTMRYWVEALGADIVLLHKTRVPQNGMAAAQAQAKDAGSAGAWEPTASGGGGGWEERRRAD